MKGNFLGATIAAACLCLGTSGCGGQSANSFVNSVHITIENGGSLDPRDAATVSGYRIVFVNNDSTPHLITFGGPINVSGTAQPGGRAWFDFPLMLPGTILHYHLDASGSSGTITVVDPPAR